MSTAATIRRATIDDADTVSSLGARTFSETFAHLYKDEDLRVFLAEAYGLDRTRSDLAHPLKASWLVEDAGRVVGYATAGPCELPHPEVGPKSFELKRFYLLKTCQNGGIGGRLWTQVLDWLLAQDPDDLWIGVWSENHGAQRFYGRHGFEKVGEYGFRVGQTIDHEFILRRQAHRNSNEPHRSTDTVAGNP